MSADSLRKHRKYEEFYLYNTIFSVNNNKDEKTEVKLKMARPTKLNDELTDLICENIELGLSYNLACQGAGITFETFNQWMKKGEAGDDKAFADFYSSVKKSDTICAKRCLQHIREAGNNGTWTASAWLLERRFRDYAKSDQLHVRDEHFGTVKIVELRTEDCGSDD
jgi:hypothetical protein